MSPASLAAWCALAGIVGAGVVYLLQEVRRNALLGELMRTKAWNAALEKEHEGLETQLISQKEWIEERTAQLGEKVLATAATLMEERGRAFTELNQKEVAAVVAPFKEQLSEFR